MEQLTKIASSDSKFNAAACDLYLCKGLQFSDNKANVQTWKAGDVVPVKIWLRIPHEGIANVSIVDTKQNKMVGEYLKLWTKGYAPGKSPSDVPLDQKEFSVMIPKGLETTCANAGDCVSWNLIAREVVTLNQCRCFSGGGSVLLRSRLTSRASTLRLRHPGSIQSVRSRLRNFGEG